MRHLLAHGACALLVAIDLLMRTWRLRLLVGGTGHALSTVDSLRCNVLADAGASLSPMRLAGEPARIAGLKAAGVPVPATLAAIGWELCVAWPTLIAITATMVAVAGREWWRESVPLLAERTADAAPMLVVVTTLAIVAVLAARRMARRFPQAARPVGLLGRSWRRMSPWRLLLSIPLTAAAILARIALLPTLALALAEPASSGARWFGSLLLVYGQLFFPTPAGIGAVEAGFLGGATGGTDPGLPLLLAWRWWATVVPTGLGLLAGWQLLKREERR